MEKLDINRYFGKSFCCPYCHSRHEIPVKKLFTKTGAIFSLPDIISKLIVGKNILILCDNNTYKAAGEKCEKVLSKSFNASCLILSSGKNKKIHAEEKYFPAILKKLKGKDAIITAGSGTITDLGKYAADKMKIPVISVPTAPSMNAYTSGVSAFISGTLKKTVPVKPAIAVVTDLDIISNAPIEMIKAGFADSLARSFANADWKLACLFTEEKFCALPYEITENLEASYIDKARQIIKRDKRMILKMMKALHLGGISMIIAGSSSPASGGEHLISHYLDMVAHKNKKDSFSLHGLQVGLGVMISAATYERLNKLDLSDVRYLLKNHKSKEHLNAHEFIRKNFGIEEELNKKLLLLNTLRKKLPFLWNKLKKEVFPMAKGSEEIKDILKNAGCPLKFSEIGVDRDLAYQAINYSRFIRPRLTVFDIAGELGILTDIAYQFTQ
ncbi:MAG TPA: iron-containing alcohol dehydrogenase [bacterium]|nr:iron-containing alcohol dehydrogenase [bacterium]HOL36116.1 iron-containing alcohol dehydrogenase [bacterium]HPP09310.1 iron-containing alcohol dehydrogenase [bacterium]